MVVVDLEPLAGFADADLHGGVTAGREGAALGHVQQVDRGSGDRLQSLSLVSCCRDGAEQALGIFVTGVIKDLIGRALLTDGARVHDDDLVAELGYDAQVMGDHDDGHAHFPLDILHELQNAGLDGHVQGRRRFVGDQDVGLAGQGHGDHDSLPHAAGKLKGILLHPLFRFIDVDQAQHLHCPVPGLLFVAVRVQQDGFHQLLSDRIGRVEAGHGILEYDGDLVAADIFHDLFVGADQLLSVILDGAGDDLSGGCQDLHDRVGRHRFAGAGFAHDPQDLSAFEIERNAVHCAHLARIGKKGGVQVFYF